jgi:hypothetical protein
MRRNEKHRRHVEGEDGQVGANWSSGTFLCLRETMIEGV